MSGHNRWSKLKRFKAVQGVVKGRIYSKVTKEITVAARLGGGDPDANPRLRTALLAAKEANMPKDNIDRAIKKGTGELEGAAYEEVLYEGYGPGGVAMLVESLTDNINRTVGDVRSAFYALGGNLGAQGSVKFLFAKKGSITVKPGPAEDIVFTHALDAGAEDILNHAEEGFEVRTEPNALHAVFDALSAKGLALGEARYTYVPSTTVQVEGETAQKLLKLIDTLEDNDDVQNVYANVEFGDGASN